MSESRVRKRACEACSGRDGEYDGERETTPNTISTALASGANVRSSRGRRRSMTYHTAAAAR